MADPRADMQRLLGMVDTLEGDDRAFAISRLRELDQQIASQASQEAAGEAQAVTLPDAQAQFAEAEADQAGRAARTAEAQAAVGEDLSTTERFLVGAGKEFSDTFDGLRQILSFNDATDAEIGAANVRKQEAFDALDAQGVGAEDVGQLVADGLLFALPGGATGKAALKVGALVGAAIEGSKATESGGTGERALQAAGGALGGAIGSKIGDILTPSGIKALAGDAANALTFGMSSRSGPMIRGLFGFGRQAALREERARVARQAGAEAAASGRREVVQRLSRENQAAADKIINNNILPVVQTLNQRGKTEVLDGAARKFAEQALQAQSPSQIQKAWRETMGVFNNATLRKEFKTHAKVLADLGEAIAKHSDKYTPDMITTLASKAAQAALTKTDKEIMAMAARGAKESTIRRLLQVAGGTTGLQGDTAIEALTTQRQTP